MCVCVCVQVRTETKARKSEEVALTGRVSSMSKLNWTIVQFNLRLFGLTKAYKAILLWTVKQEKGGRSACFGFHCLLFPTPYAV